MPDNKDNNQRPKIQSNGYNGSEPTRICPHCGKEKFHCMRRFVYSLNPDI